MRVNLNSRAWRLCQQLDAMADELRIHRGGVDGTNCWDFGVEVEGGLEAGLLLARICLADLGRVQLVATPGLPGSGFSVQVTTDQPIAACMSSQYAGWKISRGDYFAMGSGPMRAAAAVEAVFEKVPSESSAEAVGVLESRRFPPREVVQELAGRCHVPLERLALLIAPTASAAGHVQIVARSVETTIHKLLDLDFALDRIVSGAGSAPLPPTAADDLVGIGRTNDAILYGAQVTLWVRGDDASLEEVVGQIPSASSRDYGEPFARIFARYHHDFYQIDPHLFSPAAVCLVNLDTGRSFCAGQLNLEILAASFRA